MADFCDDNRFELIEKYKQKLIEETNIESAPDEMKVLDTLLFRFWQMGWLDKLEQIAQQWIPCSEQEYPSDNREVEVTCEFTRYDGKKIRYTCHASYVHRYSIESMPYDNWIDCEEYNEEKDMYYALPGWYERVHNWDDYSHCAIEDRVVAWRELPEPWKEES